MKKIDIALIAVIILSPACMIKTVFYDVNPAYESHCFGNESVAICPCGGKWKIEGGDTVFERVPEFYPYADAIAKQIRKKRKCLSVITPDIVAQKIPEIESVLYKHKNFSRESGPDDSSFFAGLHNALKADYLVFIESIFFNDSHSAVSDTVASIHTTILVFQVWDLKNRKFMYRGETNGAGEESKSGRGSRPGSDSRSGNWRIQNTAYELVKSLPACR